MPPPNTLNMDDAEDAALRHEIQEEEGFPLRLESLGEDREFHRYWWTPSDPARLWVEAGMRAPRDHPRAVCSPR